MCGARFLYGGFGGKDILSEERASDEERLPIVSCFGSLPSLTFPTCGPKLNVLSIGGLPGSSVFGWPWELRGQRWMNALMIAVRTTQPPAFLWGG